MVNRVTTTRTAKEEDARNPPGRPPWPRRANGRSGSIAEVLLVEHSARVTCGDAGKGEQPTHQYLGFVVKDAASERTLINSVKARSDDRRSRPCLHGNYIRNQCSRTTSWLSLSLWGGCFPSPAGQLVGLRHHPSSYHGAAFDWCRSTFGPARGVVGFTLSMADERLTRAGSSCWRRSGPRLAQSARRLLPGAAGNSVQVAGEW